MSGGEFQSKDRIASSIVAESLNSAIDRSNDNDSSGRNAKLMKSVSSVVFSMVA